MPSPHPQTSDSGVLAAGPSRKDGLDVLRALAIFSVLCFHAPESVRRALPDMLRAGFDVGWVGVDLFFVLSGYLIGRQVFATEDAVPLGLQLRTFWIKRWMRTLPLYFLVLAFHALKPWLLGTPFVGGGWHYLVFLQNYVGVRDFVQSWSLCVEEHFYVVLPLLAFGLHARAAPAWVWLMPWALSLGVRAWEVHTATPGLLPAEQWVRLQWPTHLHLDGLAVGVFLARTAPRWQRWPRAWRGVCGAMGVLVLAATLAGCVPHLPDWGGVWIFAGLAMGFGGLLVGTEAIALPVPLRGLVFQAAVLSYGTYLWFGVVARVFERRNLTLGVWELDLFAFIAVTHGLAWVTYVAVERPALKLRDRLLAWQASRAGASDGVVAPGR
ncbi:acyltransferase [Corallococcus sp. M34]|uniref:acyltransferase family protein n=1 Tax=Citreicoccus inhibens TaxID=2849499 RepID=UPI001C21CB90|nr:acyltransferase [Citreicoccus inhibens]MBU8896326.1 acyltransferase [Citreicoccus inhibens]